MGLAIRRLDGRNCPWLVCDACRKPIEDLSMAVCYFPMRGRAEFVNLEGVYHKGACNPKKHHDNLGMGWEQMDLYLPWLLANGNYGSVSKDERRVLVLLEKPAW